MSNLDILKHMDLCWGMNERELQLLIDISSREEYEAGELIFKEEEECDRLYILESGSIEISTRISDGTDRVLGQIHQGAQFGEMALIDDAPRSATAKAIEKSILITVLRDHFLDLIEHDPTFAAKALINLSRTISKRLRDANEALRQSIDWNLRISGATALNMHEMIRESRPIRIYLISQKEIEGILLKVEKSLPGYEITIRSGKGEIFVVPYHAVVYWQVIEKSQTLPKEESDASDR